MVGGMKMQIYQILHVSSLLILTGLTFLAIAAPRPEWRRPILIGTGILSLVMLVSAFGLISVIYGNNFTGWMIVKIVLWVILSALAGLAFRLPGRGKLLGWTATAVLILAVLMVYLKPF
ncbi:MAG: hypothetical protein EA425_11930 [Puniceicoccaceae bacterium]|nr:MAG: hypothetical protein EA425_11930 [Puniceicoccaceae bacterium]